MRVCVVNPNYYRSSGVTIAIKRIFEGSKLLPLDCYFVDCSYGSFSSELIDDDWVPVGRMFRFRLMSVNPIYFLCGFFGFCSFVISNKIEILHIHHRRLALIGAICSFLTGVKVVYTGNLPYGESFAFRFSRIHAYVAITPSVRNNIIATTFAENVIIISNPVDFSASNPGVNVSAFGHRACCVARFDPVKNHATLLTAWAICCKVFPSAELFLIGEGQLRSVLESQVTELGINKNVFFLGYLDEANVLNFIRSSSFMILPSFLEGQGIVTLEGATCRRASLLTDVYGSRDMVPAGATLPNKIKAGDVTEMASAIHFWLKNPHLVKDEGKLFFNYWRQFSSIEVVARKYYEVYERTIECITIRVV